MQSPQDLYESNKFVNNHDQRLMIKCEKKWKIIDLMTHLRKKKKISMPIPEVNLYRLHYDSKNQ